MASSDSSHSAVTKPQGFGNNKGIKFMIRTGSNTWSCSLQDRDSYQRSKSSEEPKPVQRSDSFESASSSSASTSSH